MAETGIFISSCSRRELARRRPTRVSGTLRLQVLLALALVLAVGFGAFVVARGWV